MSDLSPLLEESPFQLEEQFESLIAEHPSLLPGDQIDPEDPRRWVVVGRQVEVPSESTSWGGIGDRLID